MWIDTHCHLDAAEFDADRAEVHAAARAAGVDSIVIPAVAAGAFSAVARCAGELPGCVAAYGIHPLYVGAAGVDDLDALRQRLASSAAVAVGEIGLDGFVEPTDWDRQEAFFIAQLKLARDFDLPVLLHVRRAVDRVLAGLRRVRVRGGIAHAFNGSAQQAAQFIALGFKLGFGGAMTFPRATRIRGLARDLPLAALVLETDAPDMAPAFAAPGRNVPAYLPRIAATLASLRDMPLTAIGEATSDNARHVLGPLAAG